MKKIILSALIAVLSFSSFGTPADIHNPKYVPHTVDVFNPILEQFQVGLHTVPGEGNCVWALALYSDIWGGQTNISVFGNFSVTTNYGFRGNVTHNFTNTVLPYWQPDRGGYDYYNPCVIALPATQTYVSNTPFIYQGTE
jgi:hypothetical protein